MKLERTEIDGRNVILTEGAYVDGRKLYGMFSTERDAMSDDADRLALGTVGPDNLTAEQIALAERNRHAMEKECERRNAKNL